MRKVFHAGPTVSRRASSRFSSAYCSLRSAPGAAAALKEEARLEGVLERGGCQVVPVTLIHARGAVDRVEGGLQRPGWRIGSMVPASRTVLVDFGELLRRDRIVRRLEWARSGPVRHRCRRPPSPWSVCIAEATGAHNSRAPERGWSPLLVEIMVVRFYIELVRDLADRLRRFGRGRIDRHGVRRWSVPAAWRQPAPTARPTAATFNGSRRSSGRDSVH